MSEPELRPCPFCGGEPYEDSCDRIIEIGCRKCNYHRWWHGLITPVEHKVKVNALEYYNPNAHEEATEDWNRRVYEA